MAQLSRLQIRSKLDKALLLGSLQHSKSSKKLLLESPEQESSSGVALGDILG